MASSEMIHYRGFCISQVNVTGACLQFETIKRPNNIENQPMLKPISEYLELVFVLCLTLSAQFCYLTDAL
jgi:hypothetical protein